MSDQHASAGAIAQYLHPAGLHFNPAYTDVVVVTGPAKTIYIGTQLARDERGNLVGKGDIAAQTEQVMKNIQTALAAAGARLEHVIKWNVYLAQGQPLQPGFEAFQRAWGNRPNPPAINTVVYVPEFVPADFLVAIDAIAVLPA